MHDTPSHAPSSHSLAVAPETHTNAAPLCSLSAERAFDSSAERNLGTRLHFQCERQDRFSSQLRSPDTSTYENKMTMALTSTNMAAVGSLTPSLHPRVTIGTRNVVSMGAMRSSSYAGAPLHLRNVTSGYRKASGLSVRMEAEVKTGKGGPQPPSSPPGLGGTEIPLGVITTSAPLEQKGIPVPQRIAYICQDCGYIYDLETPFEEQSEDYNCPVCTAPKNRFVPSNSTVEETLDTTKENQN